MKKSGLTRSCFLPFLFFYTGLAAQQDHVVLKNGDTLRGVVTDLHRGKLYLETFTSRDTIDLNEVNGYYNSKTNETYSYRLIPSESKPVFITRLIDGPVRMYTYKVVSGNGSKRVTTNTWYAEKDNILIGEIKAGGLRGGKKERKDFFRSLIADNPALVKRFDEKDSMDLDFLEELINEYNIQTRKKDH